MLSVPANTSTPAARSASTGGIAVAPGPFVMIETPASASAWTVARNSSPSTIPRL
jgi:hypothetical protein